MKSSLTISLAIVHASLLAGVGALLILRNRDRGMAEEKFTILAARLADQQTIIHELEENHSIALKQIDASAHTLQSISDQIGRLGSKEDTSRIAQATQNLSDQISRL